MDNPFVLKPTDYKRDLNILRHYVEDQAFNLHRQTGKPLEVCTEWLKTQLRPGGQFEFKDPEIYFLRRGANGDRHEEVGTTLAYINESIRNHELIAPTLTTYKNPKEQLSLLVHYIDGNVKARGVAKKAKFRAMQAGDTVLAAIKDNEQNNKKLSNNAVSGAHVTPTNPLYNKTCHSTLTSTCRSTSGYGNANNEKFLNGNRHYWDPIIVKNNIVSLASRSDLDQIEKAMDAFSIRHPSVEETLECIKYSTDLYWHSAKAWAEIRKMIEYLTPVERSAFVYTGDLYHLMRFNEPLVRRFLTALSTWVQDLHPDPAAVLKSVPETYVHLAAQIMGPCMKGIDLKDIALHPELWGQLASTAEHIQQVIQAHAQLIRAFWTTCHVPASVAWLPTSIRRAALTSDTDSTIFTVQDWVEWHQGEIRFDQPANALAATMIFLAAESITHVLARMSANFGIAPERIHQIAMKNEYKFDVFVTTQVAKHYFALIGCQEGNVFKDYKEEIKGVHLRSSNAPKAVNKRAQALMREIMQSVIDGKKITMNDVLTSLADIEREIITSIKAGAGTYFRRGQVKQPGAYSEKRQPHETNYVNYLLWEEVFAPKYGSVAEPPYITLKVTLGLDSPAKVRQWLSSLEDRELAARFEAWQARYSKARLTTIMIPEVIVKGVGIPPEIMQQINVRQMVSEVTKTFSLVLESLGYFYKTEKHLRLLSDTH